MNIEFSLVDELPVGGFGRLSRPGDVSDHAAFGEVGADLEVGVFVVLGRKHQIAYVGDVSELQQQVEFVGRHVRIVFEVWVLGLKLVLCDLCERAVSALLVDEQENAIQHVFEAFAAQLLGVGVQVSIVVMVEYEIDNAVHLQSGEGNGVCTQGIDEVARGVT